MSHEIIEAAFALLNTIACLIAFVWVMRKCGMSDGSDLRMFLMGLAVVSAVSLLVFMPATAKLLLGLAVFLVLLARGSIKLTGAELAGLGVFLAGFAALYRVMEGG